jgi:hypothetical protein
LHDQVENERAGRELDLFMLALELSDGPVDLCDCLRPNSFATVEHAIDGGSTQACLRCDVDQAMLTSCPHPTSIALVCIDMWEERRGTRVSRPQPVEPSQFGTLPRWTDPRSRSSAITFPLFDYDDAKWPAASARHRKGIAEALTDATVVLLDLNDQTTDVRAVRGDDEIAVRRIERTLR